jgi:hypothetical protein
MLGVDALSYADIEARNSARTGAPFQSASIINQIADIII